MNNSQSEKTTFKSAWQKLENTKKLPSRIRNLITIESKEFEEKVFKEESSFVEEITNSIFSGDCYIIKNAFSKKFMKDLRDNTFSYFKNKPSTFHKMIEKCPNFHRKIDKEIGKKYSFEVIKHAFYFFPWNKDELKIFKPINEKWRTIKKLMGLKFDEFEKNTPKDGIVDRIQVVQYPSRDGFLETHTDPYKFQRFFISGYMSKRGEDYNGGGFYFSDKNDQNLNVEDSIDIGDLGIGYATVAHGVAPVNLDKASNFDDKNDGRWFLGLYSNQSDEVKVRHTGKAVKSLYTHERI
jgi:hypothetical protein